MCSFISPTEIVGAVMYKKRGETFVKRFHQNPKEVKKMEELKTSNFWFRKEKKGCIRITDLFKIGNSETMTKEEATELRDWLYEALKPRYEVTQVHNMTWIVWDSKEEKSVAAFHKRKEYNAKSEAERLCKQLNGNF